MRTGTPAVEPWPVFGLIMFSVAIGIAGGLVFFFADWGHATALLIHSFAAALFYSLSGSGIGYLNPKRWMVAAVLAWPSLLRGSTALIRSVRSVILL